VPVKFYIDKPNEKKQSPIFYLYHIFGFRARKSTGLKVSPAFWNAKQSRIRSSHPDHEIINDYFDNLVTRSKEVKLEFITTMVMPTKEEFLEKVFTISKNESNILERYEEFLKHKGKRLTPDSLKVYQSSINFYKQFDPELSSINSSKLEKFTEWLLDKKFSPNYIIKVIGSLVRFCKFIKVPIEIKVKVSQRKTDSISLSLDDLQLILISKMPNTSLDRVKDLFIFQCFTGLRYSDLQGFKHSYIQIIDGVKCLVFYAKKTGNKSVIPLFKEAQTILDKYSGDLPMRISGQKFNDYLKEVCKISGLTHNILVTKLRADSKEVIQVPKYEAITSHTGRRSFVSNMSYLGLTP